MGTCFCKDKIEDGEPYLAPRSRNSFSDRNGKTALADQVNKLVLDTLAVIGSIVDNEQDPPAAMMCLHSIADKEAGWIQVVESMVEVIPMDHPLGPSVITLLLDDCPLPSKESVIKMARMLDLSTTSSSNSVTAIDGDVTAATTGGDSDADATSATTAAADNTRHRNICVILGCVAEKLAGPSSVAILSPDTLDYLVNNLINNPDPHVILFSLIALEKFAQTSENKATIKRKLSTMCGSQQSMTDSSSSSNPLTRLESWWDSEDCLRRQVGFCARWCLDNLFVSPARLYSHETVDLSGVNVMLNTRDVSEYLKISPDGLEARCDSYSFESVRCTFQVDAGCWYYETTLITSGIMQIGWATRDSAFLNHEGYGIGDDPYSIAYDGCRRLVWHAARSRPAGMVVTTQHTDTTRGSHRHSSSSAATAATACCGDTSHHRDHSGGHRKPNRHSDHHRRGQQRHRTAATAAAATCNDTSGGHHCNNRRTDGDRHSGAGGGCNNSCTSCTDCTDCVDTAGGCTTSGGCVARGCSAVPACPWRPGSVLGCLMDVERRQVVFCLDGVVIATDDNNQQGDELQAGLFAHASGGFFAAASFMSFQQCRFNFGAEPFRYPPDTWYRQQHQQFNSGCVGRGCVVEDQLRYRSFNESATLAPADKVVLPRHLYLDQLRRSSVREDSCSLCFDRRATVTLRPCRHRGFCMMCSEQLTHCPMCRGTIQLRSEEEDYDNDADNSSSLHDGTT